MIDLKSFSGFWQVRPGTSAPSEAIGSWLKQGLAEVVYLIPTPTAPEMGMGVAGKAGPDVPCIFAFQLMYSSRTPPTPVRRWNGPGGSPWKKGSTMSISATSRVTRPRTPSVRRAAVW
jgi:hypothetical protein